MTEVASNNQARVGIVPYELRHHKDLASITLDKLIWPGQDADLNMPSSACIAELAENDSVYSL